MKLESLKSSKFAAFQKSGIDNLLSITGGACTNTSWSPGGGSTDDYYKESSSGRGGAWNEKDCTGSRDSTDTICNERVAQSANTSGGYFAG